MLDNLSDYRSLNCVFPINIGTIHLIGIGGIGMSGIAEVLHSLGYKVQGSDISTNYVVERLKTNGINVFLGHRASNVENSSLVVCSSAINMHNPEIVRAKEMGLPVIKRSEMLAEILRFKHAISISGTHGKTTTTSLVAFLLEKAGMKPTVINGGIINHKGTNAYMGDGPYAVAEADESDGTFIKVPSYVGVITNIDPEHLDYYKTFENAISAYRTFIVNLPFYGFGVLCYDHNIVRQLGQSIKDRRIISYSIDYQHSDLRAINIHSSEGFVQFDVQISDYYAKKKSLDSNIIANIELGLNGMHNISNTLAAIAIGIELGIKTHIIKETFKDFSGVRRRFTKVAEINDILIVDDYAHHPVEIKATLMTAKELANIRDGQVIAILQPHRYSRVEELMYEFAESFSNADTLLITDIYAAGEDLRPGITSYELTKKIQVISCKDAYYYSDSTQIIAHINNIAKKGDVVIFLGAGNITQLAYTLPSNMIIK